MFLILQEQLLVTLFLCHLRKDVDDLDQAEGVERGIVLLREAQGSSFPVGHLLTFAHLQVEQVFGHLGKSALI